VKLPAAVPETENAVVYVDESDAAPEKAYWRMLEPAPWLLVLSLPVS
jgi:hypothetical protein